MKVAVTVLLLPPMVTVHWFPEVELHPLQLAKLDPEAAAAVSVTEAPVLRFSVQSDPQLNPVPVTVPLPVPSLPTVNV